MSMNDSESKSPSRAKGSANDVRAARLEAQLRANLAKRKQQKRLRTGAAPDRNDPGCDKEDT
jgi:hypothetical protein